VMFFSFSSAMVIFTYRNASSREGSLRIDFVCRRVGTRRSCLSSPPLCLSEIFRLAQNVLPFRTSDPVQHLVHSVLNASIRPVKLARCLRGKLAEHVPVP
jgi:hypothetical protein